MTMLKSQLDPAKTLRTALRQVLPAGLRVEAINVPAGINVTISLPREDIQHVVRADFHVPEPHTIYPVDRVIAMRWPPEFLTDLHTKLSNWKPL